MMHDLQFSGENAPEASVGFQYPQDEAGACEERCTFAEFAGRALEVLERITRSGNPVRVGKLAIALRDKIKSVPGAERARELGLSRQNWRKLHAEVERLLPIGSIMTSEQRQRVSAGMVESHRRRKKGPAGLNQTGPVSLDCFPNCTATSTGSEVRQ